MASHGDASLSLNSAAEEKEGRPKNGGRNAFECKLEDTDHLITSLQTILIDKDMLVDCQISTFGMKFTVTKAKVLQAKAYIKRAMFAEFELHGEDDDEDDEEDGADVEVSFTVNLHVLLQCLQIFGGSSHMQLAYGGYGAPVCLTLEDSGVVTQCEIVTLEPPTIPDFNFRATSIVNRMALKSKILKDAFSELDVPGATLISISVSPTTPNFSMTVEGDSSQCKVDFPSEEQLCNQFEAREDMVTSYGLPIIRPCIRALAKAEHTNLRWNESGMLSMQHSIPTGTGVGASWVEYILLAQEQSNSSQQSGSLHSQS